MLPLRDIPFERLKANGIRAVVFDKDATLSSPQAIELEESVDGVLKRCVDLFGRDNVLIVSNSAGSVKDPEFKDAARVEEAMEKRLGWYLSVVRHGGRKPYHFDKVLESLPGLSAEQVMCIGDRVATDVIFGNSNGALTVCCHPLLRDRNTRDNILGRMELFLIKNMVATFGYTAPIHPFFVDLEINHIWDIDQI